MVKRTDRQRQSKRRRRPGSEGAAARCGILRRLSRGQLAGIAAVVLLGGVVNTVGLYWGLSGNVPWQPDSNEGITIVREMPRLFGKWTYKYPRGHFLLNAIFYHPLLEHWRKNPVAMRNPDGRVVYLALTQERLAKLAVVTRLISVVMGAGIVVAVFLIAMRLFGDYLAAILAAGAISVTQLFVFYCHQGNLYVPYTCWFAWGFYFMLAAVQEGKWRHYVLMALLFAFSVCTYDAVAGYLAGTAVAFCLAQVVSGRRQGKGFRGTAAAVFSKKLAAAAVVFVFCYALVQGMLTDSEAFKQRMGIWMPAAWSAQLTEWFPKTFPAGWASGRGVEEFNVGFEGHLPLLRQACGMLYGSVGWPLLLAVIGSLVYVGTKEPWKAAFAVLPLAVFYLVIILNIRMFLARYLMPGFVGMAVLVGRGCADLLRHVRLPAVLRGGPVAGVYVLSLLYCVGLDLEMLHDTRARAERWFEANVTRRASIGAGIYNRVYAPRLYLSGYRMICPWRSASVRDEARYPDYLIISPGRLEIREPLEQDFREKLFAGELPYDEVARFKARYLWPARSLLGLAGWPVVKHWLLSPEIIVYKKRAAAMAGAGVDSAG